MPSLYWKVNSMEDRSQLRITGMVISAATENGGRNLLDAILEQGLPTKPDAPKRGKVVIGKRKIEAKRMGLKAAIEDLKILLPPSFWSYIQPRSFGDEYGRNYEDYMRRALDPYARAEYYATGRVCRYCGDPNCKTPQYW